MLLDHVPADAQAGGDRLVGGSGGDQPEYLDLPTGQTSVPGAVVRRQARGAGGVRDRADPIEDVVCGLEFQPGTVAIAERISAPPAPAPGLLSAGRIAVGAVAVAALPGFVGALAEIT